MTTRRKTLIAIGCALGVPEALLAQQSGRVWRVGFLATRSRPENLDSDWFGAFARGMRDLGYVEGRNLVIEWRFADNKIERLDQLAGELVGSKVDVLVAAGSTATGAARKATATLPIVMVNPGDPVASGYAASLARPGGNITGPANLIVDLSAKHLELLTNLSPGVSRVAVLMNPTSPSNAQILKDVQLAVSRIAVKIVPIEAKDAADIARGFAVMARDRVEALIVASNPLFVDQRHQIAELALKNRLLSITASRAYAEVGLLMSYGPDVGDQYRRAAYYVDKILKGAKPGELPVEQATRFEVIVNMKTAKALGITIPQSILVRADRVIE